MSREDAYITFAFLFGFGLGMSFITGILAICSAYRWTRRQNVALAKALDWSRFDSPHMPLASGMEARQGQDPQGLDAKHDSPTANGGDAQNPSKDPPDILGLGA